MNTSYTLQQNYSELLNIPRKLLFGANADSREYKDSYILSEIILKYPLEQIELLKAYSEEDTITPKVSKSVTLRANAHEKLVFIANSLKVSESEASRLLIFHFSKQPLTKRDNQISPELEKELACLKKAVEEANRALEAIVELLK